MQMLAPSRCERVAINGLTYNVRHWGRDDAPLLLMLHGWMDSSASFQFTVDALRDSWHVLAPDWRGYGQSEWLNRRYWFADYYADLDALLDRYSPDVPVRIVGHSMGGAVASIYGGARPDRIAGLLMVDFLGLPPNEAHEAPGRIREWLDHTRATPQMRAYANREQLAARLLQFNARLLPERAVFLALHCASELPDGQFTVACDPWHKVPSPQLYRVEEVMACWRAMTAPVRLVTADEGYVLQRFEKHPDELQRRMACFAKGSMVRIDDCGHNVQHDRPEKLAELIEAFFVYPAKA
ncbi:MAG: alpha/beta hydrolase [Candidatus Accumulibacter sp.]|uniref:Alpha/beta hydrolase n=1 Tax=Candidatus Accumulibacter affinis TaxID=2954384 RepID=A0A935TGZ4_9PROT|nr:alpha/beta hydrolase [Candidatus Accumulibacter affinis]